MFASPSLSRTGTSDESPRQLIPKRCLSSTVQTSPTSILNTTQVKTCGKLESPLTSPPPPRLDYYPGAINPGAGRRAWQPVAVLALPSETRCGGWGEAETGGAPPQRSHHRCRYALLYTFACPELLFAPSSAIAAMSTRCIQAAYFYQVWWSHGVVLLWHAMRVSLIPPLAPPAVRFCYIP